MYGLPDSAIVGSAKRLGRMGKVRKHEMYDYEEDFLDWAIRKLQAYNEKTEAKRKEKAKQEELARKHKVRFF